MATDDKTTPRPWKVGIGYHAGDTLIYTEAPGTPKGRIAIADCEDAGADGEANAELIVRAVNAYDQLMAIFVEWRANIDRDYENGTTYDIEAFDAIRRALDIT